MLQLLDLRYFLSACLLLGSRGLLLSCFLSFLQTVARVHPSDGLDQFVNAYLCYSLRTLLLHAKVLEEDRHVFGVAWLILEHLRKECVELLQGKSLGARCHELEDVQVVIDDVIDKLVSDEREPFLLGLCGILLSLQDTDQRGPVKLLSSLGHLLKGGTYLVHGIGIQVKFRGEDELLKVFKRDLFFVP